MKIEELKNQKVKISSRSITCKDENGKTKGVVSGAVRFKDLQPNKAINYFNQIKSAGLWGNGEIDNVYISEGKIYYFFNLRPIEVYENVFVGESGCESEKEKYIQRKQLAENASKIGIVIPVYILN